MTDIENIKTTISEISSGIEDQVSIPVFYKYRYTFDKSTSLDEQISLAKNIIKLIKERYACDNRLTAGIEHFTKGKLETKPHLHVHFISKKNSNTIRKGLALEFNFIGRCQCCKAETIVNEDKFFRYPLKQQKNDTFRWGHAAGFTQDEKLIMVDVAYSIWIVSAEVAVEKLQKKIERNSEDRLFHVLDNLFSVDPPTTYYGVMSIAMRYYADNEPTFNYQTIVGYVDKYLILRGIIMITQYLKIKDCKDFSLPNAYAIAK